MEERFINPYTDYGFKKLFGTEENADLLISFLNALISDEGDPITSITYKNVEHIGEINTMRSSYFDVFCQTQSGADFIVEMQNGKQIYFKDRSPYYAAKPIREQGRKGKAKAAAEAKALEVKLAKSGVKDVKNKKVKKGWDYHLKDVYLVAIMDFIFPGNEYPDNEYYHMVKLMDVKDKHVFYDKLTLIYLEMPKLKDMAFHLETMREKWMYALYSLCYTDERPPELQEEVFLKLFHEAELANFNETQLFSYEMSLKDLWDSYSTWECANQEGIAKGKELGLAEGKELGLAEGEKSKALEVARKMKSLGMDDDTITQVTGLPADAVEKL
ncbi:MAG: PD-(D/E)XK nuclease family transposase [Bacteroidales bacterium]|nr:PD-(D/E)XK nuclease family transposase [Bacteroidales bacterium]